MAITNNTSQHLPKASILLFSLLLTLPSIVENNPSSYACSESVTDNSILFVGGFGEGNHSTVQSALENATRGDTIFVFNGNYNVSCKISKRITLIGESAQSTRFFNQGKFILNVRAGNVKISHINFTCENKTGIGIKIEDGNSEIQNNTFNLCYQGISCESIALGTLIRNNTFINRHNQGFGIALYTSNNLVSSNYFRAHDYAIDLRHGSTNLIENNIMISKGSTGIRITGINKGNVFQGNSFIDVKNAFQINAGYDMKISHNIFDDTARAINCCDQVGDIDISRNLFYTCGIGVELITSHNSTIHDNHFVDNIECIALKYGSLNNSIYNNRFLENKRCIYLSGTDNNTIQNNDFHHNHVVINSNRHGQSNSVNSNNIINNTLFARLSADLPVINASHNWWGTDKGPHHEFENPDGEGHTLSNQTAFLPYSSLRFNFEVKNAVPLVRINWGLSLGGTPLMVQFSSESFDIDGSIVAYNWSFGDGGSSQKQSPLYEYRNPGYYWVSLTVIDTKGRTGFMKRDIGIQNETPEWNRLPWVDLETIFGPFYVGEIIHFNSTGIDPDGVVVSQIWDFGDGNMGYGENVNHTYSQPGKYRLTVTITDNYGDSSSTARDIFVYVEQPDEDDDNESYAIFLNNQFYVIVVVLILLCIPLYLICRNRKQNW